MNYAQIVSDRNVHTPQNQPIPGREDVMAKNNAGGYSFVISPWERLTRFLVLGSEGGTYYVGQQKLTRDNAQNVIACIKSDGARTVDAIVAVSEAGRAPKNEPAIFALALCAVYGDEKTRGKSYLALSRVARTGTHLFAWVEAINELKGWSHGARNAVARWYNEKTAANAAYQVVKYQERNGWSHRDVLRLGHVLPVDAAHSAVNAWAVGKPYDTDIVPSIINVYEAMKAATTEKEIVRLITDHQLTWEFVPGQWLGSKDVWAALLPNLPVGALLRNLARITANGLLTATGDSVLLVKNKLTNADALRKARIHPVAVLNAMGVYSQGHGERGSLTWNPVPRVASALEDAFYASFGAVEATNKRIVFALDVSYSMEGNRIAGTSLTARTGSVAMMMTMLRTEDRYEAVAFSDKLVRIKGVDNRTSLSDAQNIVRAISMGGTDCALPMIWAKKEKVQADAFVVYCVDTETEILTANGWKHYNEVVAGEEVYTLNHENGQGEWQLASAINVFPAEKRELVLMEGRGHSSLTTLNHRWCVRSRGYSEWKRTWKETQTLNTVDYIQCSALDNGLPTVPVHSDAFVELVAWAWTEGHWNDSGALSLCQSSNVNGDNCDSIRAALEEMYGAKSETTMHPHRFSGTAMWVEKTRPNGMTFWHLNQEASKPFMAIMPDKEKVVNYAWLRSLTIKQLDLFIDVSMKADGDSAKNRLAQKSIKRAEAFAFACILAGKAVSYMAIDNDHNDGLEIGILRRKQLAPIANATNTDDRPFKVEHVEHEGIVWCPTTPNGSWLARRNGTVYWTGNTDSETWFNRNMHPVQALRDYREATGIPAKLIVVGMTATEFSIADPADKGNLDVVGFSSDAPSVISMFISGT